MSTEYGIVGDWIVQSVDVCTCGGGFGTLPHEPGCGAEPLERVSVALAAADEIRSVRAALGRAETQLAATEDESWRLAMRLATAHGSIYAALAEMQNGDDLSTVRRILAAALAAGQPQPQAAVAVTHQCVACAMTGDRSRRCPYCSAGQPAVEPQTEPQCSFRPVCPSHARKGCTLCVAAPVGVDPQEPPATVPLDDVIAEFGYTRADLADDGEHWCPECEVYYDGKGCPIAHTADAVGVDPQEPPAREWGNRMLVAEAQVVALRAVIEDAWGDIMAGRPGDAEETLNTALRDGV